MDTQDIWTKFNDQLHQLICIKVKHDDYCHDILQEVYIKVLKNIDKIGKADSASAYLARMANNAVTDHFRRKASFHSSHLPDDFEEMQEEVVTGKALQLADCCLRPMIESLPEIYRVALIRTELDGLKLKDFAIEAGISLSNAKARVQRAKEKLKNIILDCCHYEFDRYGNIVDTDMLSKKPTCKN